MLNSDSRIFLRVIINNITYSALVDSGSSKSYINGSVAENCAKHNNECVQSEVSYARVADGSLSQVTGTYFVSLSTNGQTYEGEFRVIPSLTVSVLLGLDWLMKLKVSICFSSKSIKCEKNSEVSDLNALIELSGDQKTRLNEFLSDQFKKWDDVVNPTHNVTHVIRLKPGAVPVKQRHYPRSPAVTKILHEEVDKMEQEGIVEKCSSPWSSEIVLVKKPSGAYRCALNLKKVNELSVKDAYPMPFISSILDKLRDARMVTKLDLKNGYWQVPLSEESKDCTAFTIPGKGLYRFKVMPFGHHSSGSTFQRLLDSVIGAELEPYAFPYQDDIIVTSPFGFDHHLQVLENVFNRLRSAGLKLNIKKCEFCKSELIYLGHKVTSTGIGCDPQKISAITEYPRPSNVRELRAFLGMCSWYRRFIESYSDKAEPLNRLLKKKNQFSWQEDQERAFCDLKTALTSAPILSCPDFSEKFYVHTDASLIGVAATLSQHVDGSERVIAYYSRTLSEVESRYSGCERECLAVLCAVRKFRPYLEGYSFVIVTDCQALKYMNNLSNPSGRLARWALELQHYDYEVQYRAGALNKVPDALSRAPCASTDEVVLVEEDSCTGDWWSNVFKKVKDNPQSFPDFKIEGENLFKKKYNRLTETLGEEGACWKLCVKLADRARVLEECHSAPASGHVGRYKTWARVSAQYFWPGLYRDVDRMVSKCKVCQQYKTVQRKPGGLMGVRNVHKPWHTVHTDLIGPLVHSSLNNCYLLLFQDDFSKWVEYCPLRRATAQTVSAAFEKLVLFRHGTPEILLSDNGKQYKNKLFSSLAKEFGLKHEFTPLYSPQNNAIERTNKTVKCMISQFVGNNHKSWDRHLHELIFAWNTSVSVVTGFTPAFLLFGRELKTFNSLRSEVQKDNEMVERREYVSSRAKRLEQAYVLVEQSVKDASMDQKKYYDLRRRPLSFNVNDRVLRRNYALSEASKNIAASLTPKFLGPFIVSQKLGANVYVLKDDNGKNAGKWHVKDLKPFIS